MLILITSILVFMPMILGASIKLISKKITVFQTSILVSIFYLLLMGLSDFEYKFDTLRKIAIKTGAEFDETYFLIFLIFHFVMGLIYSFVLAKWGALLAEKLWKKRNQSIS